MQLKSFILFAFIGLVIASCSKEDESESTNPFDNSEYKPPVDTSMEDTLSYGSFQYMYHHIFNPTCANSGCHDGTFPPDFRTIYSSYNTLVNHPVIQNDPDESFKYRVEPGSGAISLLNTRLTSFMPNTSGIMPLVVDTGSDYNERKDEYIEMIQKWIEAGAPDTYGNLPGESNPRPQVQGILVFESGNTSTPLARLDNKPTNPIIIPNTPIDVWVSISDDKTAPADFKLTQIKSSKSLFDFSQASSQSLQASGPIQFDDFYGNAVDYTHKASFNFSTDTSNTFIYLRTYLQDGQQSDTTEIPNQGTNDIIRSYFTLKMDTL